MKARKFLLTVIAASFVIGTSARENTRFKEQERKSTMKALEGNCTPATAETDLSINNVRARILGGGDMWWDLSNNPRYEVPKGSGKHAMFAGALWLGGLDEANQLKMAAMTYRQRGVDFWPGPLSDDGTASVTAETCSEYDRQWLIYRDEVATHRAWIECKGDPDCDVGERFPGYEGNVPQVIQEWPGNGIDGNLPNKLAPYFELDSNGTPGIYEWQYDYPGYDLDRAFDCRLKEVDVLYGDETIWWVYNDKGNVHTETQAGALGFEIRAQAFAFTSNDEINNMTFNNYRIINKSTFRLEETYFGTWFDPDLGNPDDDIIGCDIARGLGYCYNSSSNDDGPKGYGLNPPAVGFDFFQGPFADYYDGIDNDRDGCVDGVLRGDTCIPEDPLTGINERIIMSGFMYYNNSGTVQNQNTADPTTAQEFYNYLTVKWKDGNNLVIETPSGKGSIANGDGYNASNVGTATKFAYPGLSYDTTGAYEPSAPVDWWESPENNADKRGLHSAGPFSLAPGALNFITTGTVWARNFQSSDIFASVNDVIIADDKAQQLFDNCFQILDGPTSPSVEVVELDREIVLKFLNAYTPQTIGYEQVDPLIPAPDNWTQAQIDSAMEAGYFSYRFEGFQIFQVANPDVAVDDIYDASQSRLVAQCDLKNDVGQLVNYEVDQDLENNALVPQDMTLQAENEGIRLTFSFTEDAFAEGDRRLINNKEYYYYVIAYSQNQWAKTDPRNLGMASQKTPYLAGRNIGNGQKPYLAIPHKTENVKGGTILNAGYGDEVQITRLDGGGNSGNFLRLSQQSEESIVFSYYDNELQYLPDGGPLRIKVVDPTSVPKGKFMLTFENATDTASWYITDLSNGNEVARSEYNISFLGEQIIDTLGLSVTMINQERPGYDVEATRNNGIIGAEMTFADEKVQWLTGISDDESESPTNWILAGSRGLTGSESEPYDDYSVGNPELDQNGLFETILNGTWAPAAFASSVPYDLAEGALGYAPRFSVPISQMYPVPFTASVNVVITKDQSKWTRCPVIELGRVAANNEGQKPTYTLRGGPTMDKDGNGGLIPNPSNPGAATGWSYFPGYAINVETGRRLNMAFGEASWLKSENGDDMIWNPSSTIQRPLGDYVMGGMHCVYIFADSVRLTSGQTIDLAYRGDDISQFPLLNEINAMNNNQSSGKTAIFRSMYWINFPLVSSSLYEYESYSEIPNDVRISLRMASPYHATGFTSDVAPQGPNNGIPQYMFNTDGQAAVNNDMETASDALDLIRVVPNPYNGSSQYEDTQLDNVVKITNLPQSCKISIFMTNGTLIRTINKDNTMTFVEWDLKNDYNVPISSGIYLIHIDAGPIGEKVVKWMGTLRPVDLNAF